MYHLIWCLFSIFAALFLSLIGRVLIKKILNDSLKLHFDEFAANFVCAVVVMELFVINYVQHNEWFFLSATFVYLFLKNLFFVNCDLYATPLAFLSSYYLKNRSRDFTFLKVFTIILTQTIATLFGQIFTKNLWLYEDPVHVNVAEEKCITNISHHHSMYECFIVEMFGVFICALVDFIVPERFSWYTRPLATLITVYNLGYITGTWMNPMLASAFTFRCSGHRSDLEHFLVYWIAPFCGLFLAWEFFYLASNLSKTATKEKKGN